MRKYKPSYLGSIMPVDNKEKMDDFFINKYESFSEIYDACKDFFFFFSGISMVESEETKKIKIKLICSEETIDKIKAKKIDIQIENNVITTG